MEEIMARAPKSELIPSCPQCKVKAKRTVLKPNDTPPQGLVMDISWEELYYCPLCFKELGLRNFTVSSSISIV